MREDKPTEDLEEIHGQIQAFDVYLTLMAVRDVTAIWDDANKMTVENAHGGKAP
jgi:hypothetical protein